MADIPISFGSNVDPRLEKAVVSSPYVSQKNGQKVVESNNINKFFASLPIIKNIVAILNEGKQPKVINYYETKIDGNVYNIKFENK